jgi:hypothetical protein
MKRWSRYVLVLPVLVLLAAIPASAQTSVGMNGWGLRVGVSSSPDQFYGGAHFEMGELARHVRWRPNIEIGFGDNNINYFVQFNIGEFHYVFSKVQVWTPYVGGSVGLNWVNFDAGNGDDTESDVGLMGVGGIETKLKSGTAFFLEAKLGITNDDPDFKIGAGWSWK